MAKHANLSRTQCSMCILDVAMKHWFNMKSLIFGCIAMFTGIISAHADTIDFYHVYFHDKQIGDFGPNNPINITLKIDSIKLGDSIRVNVGGCGGPQIGNHELFITNDRTDATVYYNATSQTRGFIFPLAELVAYQKRYPNAIFVGVYQPREPGRIEAGIRFTIHLE